MSKTVIQFIVLYLALLIAQAVIFNHICLFGVAIPLVFIYLILRLPASMKTNYVLTIAFLVGLSVDIFSDTLGMNAFACTLLALLRQPVLKLYVPRGDDIGQRQPSLVTLGTATYLKYTITATLIYCTSYFLVESFTFFDVGKLVLRIISSTLLTAAIIVAIDSFNKHK